MIYRNCEKQRKGKGRCEDAGENVSNSTCLLAFWIWSIATLKFVEISKWNDTTRAISDRYKQLRVREGTCTVALSHERYPTPSNTNSTEAIAAARQQHPLPTLLLGSIPTVFPHESVVLIVHSRVCCLCVQRCYISCIRQSIVCTTSFTVIDYYPMNDHVNPEQNQCRANNHCIFVVPWNF